MSDQANGGGPAFPRPYSEEEHCGDRFPKHAQEGMTLRDWFAGQALAGVRANPETTGDPDGYASEAYQLADAMLKARQEKTA